MTNTVVLNAGDAAILQATIGILRRALGRETRFLVYDQRPRAARRHYPEYEFRRPLERHARSSIAWTPARRLVGALKRGRLYASAWAFGHGLGGIARRWTPRTQHSDLAELAAADLVVSTGGTYLVENYSLDERLVEFRVALLARRPLVLFTQSLGPFDVPRNRRALRRVVRRSVLTLVRDERSLRHLRDLGVPPERVEVSADAVFAIERPPLRPRDHGTESAPRVAISVRHWQYFERTDEADGNRRYRDAVRQVVEHLVARGVDVTFVSTCQGVRAYRTDDSRVAAAIAGDLSADARSRVTVDREFRPPRKLIETLADFDLVVATRMHAAILALVAGTPALPIAYEFKTQELFDRLGLGDRVQQIEGVTGPGLIQAVEEMLGSGDELLGSMLERVEHEREVALASGERVRTAWERDAAPRRRRR